MNTQMRRLVAGKGVFCPVCGHDHACMISSDGEMALCIRVESGCMKDRNGVSRQAKGGMGWFHKVSQNDAKRLRSGSLPSAARRRKLSVTELRVIIKQQQADLTDKRLKLLANNLGVSERSLQAFGVGWDVDFHSYTFPMFSGDGKPCGVRMRDMEWGKKFSLPGSSNGLFIPNNYRVEEVPELSNTSGGSPLLLVSPEGPTDCCAAFDLGFRAVGRPSNMAGGEYLRDLLNSSSVKQDIVLLADYDKTKWLKDGTPFWPGWEGALHVAHMILSACKSLKVIKPPDRSKDLRQWFNGGGQPKPLMSDIASAPVADRAWLVAKTNEVATWKQGLKRQKASVA